MSSSRSIARAIVVALAAVSCTAGIAHAKTGAGQLGGYVTDADTGLGLGNASVSWQGGNPATSDPTGRRIAEAPRESGLARHSSCWRPCGVLSVSS